MKIVKIALLTLFLSSAAYAQAPLPETEFQVWNDTQLAIPLIKTKDKKSEKLSLLLMGTLRVGRNVTHLVDERVGFAFEYKVNKYLTVTPGFIYRAIQPVEGRKEYEHRIRFDVGLEKKFAKFTLRNRGRFEHRSIKARRDNNRYRNRVQLLIPVKRDGKEVFAPYVADEVYYNITGKFWARNEISFGISKKFSDTFSADFYYMLQNNRGPVYRYMNVIGTNFKFKIK